MWLEEEGNKSIFVSSIVISRIIFSPIFFYLIINGYKIASLVILFLAFYTDYLDGKLVKKYNLNPVFSLYLDPLSDFIFILFGFTAFVIKGIFPLILLFVLSLMFVQFVISSGFKIPVYDPIGKYYGAFLFLAVGIIPFLEKNSYNLVFIIIMMISFVSVASRIIFFKNKKLNK